MKANYALIIISNLIQQIDEHYHKETCFNSAYYLAETHKKDMLDVEYVNLITTIRRLEKMI